MATREGLGKRSLGAGGDGGDERKNGDGEQQVSEASHAKSVGDEGRVAGFQCFGHVRVDRFRGV